MKGVSQNSFCGSPVYYKKICKQTQKKAAALLQTAGLQLPGDLFPNNGFVHSIKDYTSPVKPNFKNVTETQQFKGWFGDWEKNPNTASKLVNEDGTPKVVYRGTDNALFDGVIILKNKFTEIIKTPQIAYLRGFIMELVSRIGLPTSSLPKI